MLRLLITLCFVTVAVYGQVIETTNYLTDDGHGRREVIEADGTVRGEYSYTNPDGKKITVKYSAGKDGFKVEGDHLPKPPAVPQHNPAPQHQQQPYQQQQYQPQPNQQYQPQPYQQNFNHYQQQPYQQNFNHHQQQPYQFPQQPQGNRGFQAQQQLNHNFIQQQPPQQYQGFQQQYQNPQQSSLPVPQLPSLNGGGFQSSPNHFSQSPSSLGSLPAGAFQFQQQPQQQQYYPQQRNGGSATVNVSQQPGSGGFNYNINS